MEINKCNSAISAYKVNGSYETVRREMIAPASAVKNRDKAEFSASSKSKSITNSKYSIKGSIESFASAGKIASLKSLIADGNYNVPAEAVAASIFEG